MLQLYSPHNNTLFGQSVCATQKPKTGARGFVRFPMLVNTNGMFWYCVDWLFASTFVCVVVDSMDAHVFSLGMVWQLF